MVSGMDPKRKDYRAELLPSGIFTKEPIRKECDTVILYQETADNTVIYRVEIRESGKQVNYGATIDKDSRR